MKKLIVHEINIELHEKWPFTATYPKSGLYWVSCPGIDSFLVNVKDDTVLYIGELSDELFEKEEKINTFPKDTIKNFEPVKEKEIGVVSEDFALQMLSVALHKQKV